MSVEMAGGDAGEEGPTPDPAPRTTQGPLRLELRVERHDVTFRFTFAFHAREVRFERDLGEGFERIFPETFSFHVARHDPTELLLQLDDLMRKPRLISPAFTRRDSVELVTRLLSEAARYLEQLCTHLEAEGRLTGTTGLRVRQDAALLAQLLHRFIETRDLNERRSLRVAGYLLRKLVYRNLRALVVGRVEPDYLAAYMRGEVDPVEGRDDPSESGFFHILEAGDQAAINRTVLRMAEREFFLWVEGICLDEENQAFEKKDSPFGGREEEVLAAVLEAAPEAAASGEPCPARIERSGDLVPFLRRRSRDSLRVLERLERWFLLQYDISNASAMIHHAAALAGPRPEQPGRSLSWHRPSIHAAMLLGLLAPFLAAAVGYSRAPLLFDWLCAAELMVVNAAVVWFLVYRFVWKRDLSFFRAAVPRIGAGIIVGYLPVFLIDEVWDLAGQSFVALATLATLLGLATLLYIYVEVEGRLGDPELAFRRAASIFLLGIFQAVGIGLLMTGLVGRFMVVRNWSPPGNELPMDVLRGSLQPWLGELPTVVGVEPLYVFPSAVLMMTFLSFFIGIFLQLMWEDIAITESL